MSLGILRYLWLNIWNQDREALQDLGLGVALIM